MKRMHKRSPNQSGFVSIMVTLIIMTILTLILIGHARIMQREKAQALDRELSTQAYYAAESGVNDAAAYLKTNPTYTINSCDNTALNTISSQYPTRAQLSAAGDVRYTCVLIDPSPSDLQYTAATDKSIIVPVHSGSSAIDTINVSWEASDSAQRDLFTTNASHFLPQKNSNIGNWPWQATGVLRTSILSSNDTGTLSEGNLDDRTYFLYPLKSNAVNSRGAVTYPTQDATITDGNCNVDSRQGNGGNFAYACNVSIKVSAATANKIFYLRLKSTYTASNVAITAKDSSGNTLPLVGTQASIDVTGKANDVLRRIQVRRPLDQSYYFPEYALQVFDGICKRLEVYSGGGSINAPNANDPNNFCYIQ